MKYIYYLLLIAITFCSSNINAQFSYGGEPFSTSPNFRLQNEIPVFSLPFIDNLLEENKSNVLDEGRFYGKNIKIEIDILEQGLKQRLGNGDLLTLLKIESPSAYSLQFFFSEFEMPDGGKLFLYNEDRSMVLGAFTNDNYPIKPLAFPFGTAPISGKSIYIEYLHPNRASSDAKLVVGMATHIFLEGFLSAAGPYGNSGDCHKNASCPPGYGWEAERSSVAIILTSTSSSSNPYAGYCSGALVNNTLQDGYPYFLTAAHCGQESYFGSTSLSADHLSIFLFNHETSDCNDDGDELTSLYQSIYGAFPLSHDDFIIDSDDRVEPLNSDYFLMELNTYPEQLKSFNVCYAGWNRTSSVAGPPYYGFHHPRGDVKKMSIEYQSLSTPNQNEWLLNWDYGATSKGSSGSPLFDRNHKLIGQLFHGNWNCLGFTAYYGQFARSWDLGFFSYWLDPGFTGATEIGTYCPGPNCNNGIQDPLETDIDCGGNCPPCGWYEGGSGNVGWSTCFNGIQDEDESGIDCGGNCRPCGSVDQCNNCKLDGDEVQLDCGGSCLPCDSDCDLVYKNYSSSTNSLPSTTRAIKYITAGLTSSQINVSIESSQNIVFTAGDSIILKPGFRAKPGSSFFAKCLPCDCKELCIATPLFNAFSPNNPDGINDELCFNVTGATNYELDILRYPDNYHFNKSGVISSNNPCLWDGFEGFTTPNSGFVYYRVIIKFYGVCSDDVQEVDYLVNVSYASARLQDLSFFDFEEIKIFPNPTHNNVTIRGSEMGEYLLYNSFGQEVLKGNKQTTSQDVDMSPLANGLYLLRINGKTHQLIKQ